MKHAVEFVKPTNADVGARRGAKRKVLLHKDLLQQEDLLQYVQQLRDAAVELVEAQDIWERFERLPKHRVGLIKVGGLGFVYRTPLSGELPAPSDHEKRLRALHGRPTEILPYCLGVWESAAGNLLSVDWNFDGELYLRNFRRGDWEAEILRLVGNLEIAA
jgi:hypothetical protein